MVRNSAVRTRIYAACTRCKWHRHQGFCSSHYRQLRSRARRGQCGARSVFATIGLFRNSNLHKMLHGSNATRTCRPACTHCKLQRNVRLLLAVQAGRHCVQRAHAVCHKVVCHGVDDCTRPHGICTGQESKCKSVYNCRDWYEARQIRY